MAFLAGSTSQLIKTGSGILQSIVISTNTDGVLTFRDGLEDSSVTTKGSASLTISGVITPGVHPETTLTASANVNENDTITLGDITYTYKTDIAGAVPYVIKLGADREETILNTFRAINCTDTGGGYYSDGTLPHPYMYAYDKSATTLTIAGTTVGTSLNTLATTETSSRLSFSASTLGAGTGGSIAGVDPEGFEIRGASYVFVDKLTETISATSVPYQILRGADTEEAITNANKAINRDTGAGSLYSTATKAHPLVTSNSATATRLGIEAISSGGETTPTTLSGTLTNGSWNNATLTGGSTAGITIFDSLTIPASIEPKKLDLPEVPFATGLYIHVEGTVNYTVFYE